MNDLRQCLIDVWARLGHIGYILMIPMTNGTDISMPAFQSEEDIFEYSL